MDLSNSSIEQGDFPWLLARWFSRGANSRNLVFIKNAGRPNLSWAIHHEAAQDAPEEIVEFEQLRTKTFFLGGGTGTTMTFLATKLVSGRFELFRPLN